MNKCHAIVKAQLRDIKVERKKAVQPARVMKTDKGMENLLRENFIG
jgi:hypothetical protein